MQHQDDLRAGELDGLCERGARQNEERKKSFDLDERKKPDERKRLISGARCEGIAKLIHVIQITWFNRSTIKLINLNNMQPL